jgi:hypothetical protein
MGNIMGWWSRETRSKSVDDQLDRLAYELRLTAAANIAAAMINVSNRPHSVHQALQVVHDVRMALEEPRADPDYQEWVRGFDGAKVHS